MNEAPVKELITYEEIQNDRKSQFEKDLGRLQEEFTNSMALPVPEVPTFADNYEDTPITEMDKMIKEMTAKRNYEVEQINRNSQDPNNVANWLQPQETSIKTEKFVLQNQSDETNQPNSRLKYVNTLAMSTDNNDKVASSITPKKNVTWGKDKEIIEKDEMEENIFKKLKKVGSPKENVQENDNDNRITNLEKVVNNLNQKVDLLIDLLKQNK